MNDAQVTATMLDKANASLAGTFFAFLGLEVTARSEGVAEAKLTLEPHHLNPGKQVHGGVIASLCDSVCGFGCRFNLPEGATGFGTTEMSTNLVGGSRAGDILECRAELRHGGRSIQVWDAVVRSSANPSRPIAYFRCTQMIMYPRASASGPK